MTKALVIVESPAKAKTISAYLGDGYTVESSIGHVRDLPANAAEVPKAYKSQPWARLGIDVDNDFKPLYVISRGKRQQISKLRKLVAQADELYLATDEDREGEAIAWHLIEVLNPRVPVKRMVFHEITESAIWAAVNSPRQLDRRLVDAQEARRLLDRLYGYEVSPVLWKKVMPRLSAGRVQSVATRIVVERERERMAFTRAAYWSLTGVFAPVAGERASPGGAGAGDAASDAADDPGAKAFKAKLVRLDGSRLAKGRDFNSDGEPVGDVVVLDADAATALTDSLGKTSFTVLARKAKPYRRRPAPPFITSTLQQEAARKLRMPSSIAMRTAQSLYEQGFITYMRTDSTTLSSTAVKAARSAVRERYGPALLPSAPRVYTGKTKNAQEAHEAIRPAGDAFPTPGDVARKVPASAARLYELIWKRTLASQMIDCTGETVRMRLGGTSSAGQDVEFAAAGTVISQPGFREVYTEGTDAGTDPSKGADSDIGEGRLPLLEPGDALSASAMAPRGHETKPPARYTEASLVKRLEQLGVGRPSTYASILQTVIDRGYVWKKSTALVPSFTAFSVVNLLERHFPKMVDYDFTAEMEDDLDKIACGAAETVPWLSRFYFGSESGPGLKEKVSSRLDDIDAQSVNTISIGTDDDGVGVAVRVGRYGPYVQRGGESASLPEGVAPDELTCQRALELLASDSGKPRVLGTDPVSGGEVVARTGRFGPYVQLLPVEEKSRPGAGSRSKGAVKPGSRSRGAGRSKSGGRSKPREAAGKPKSASLFKSMTLDALTLEDALKLLSLPRAVGADPSDGVEITAHNGRYGPYVKRGSDSRSLDSEDQLFTVTVKECLALFAQPKPRGRYGRAASRAPLRELGADPETGKPVVVKDGRWGPYATDGDVNASLRVGDTVEGLTIERASELLADRRARGPAGKAGGARKKAGGARKKAGGARKKAGGARKKAGGARKKAGGARKKAGTGRRGAGGRSSAIS